MGNKDVSKLTMATKGELEIEIPYTMSITTFRHRLSVYISIWWSSNQQKHPTEAGFSCILVQVLPLEEAVWLHFKLHTYVYAVWTLRANFSIA